jgi:hypothetical protein
MHLLALAIAFVLHFCQIPLPGHGAGAGSSYHGASPAATSGVTDGAGGSDPWGG